MNTNIKSNLSSVLRILALLLVLSGAVKAKNIPEINTAQLNADSMLWNLKQLSKAPDMHWVDSKSRVKALEFDGLTYKEKPTKVFAYYSNPDLIRGLKPSNQKFPGIILAHGGGGKAFKQWVEKWAAEGYAAMAIDFSGTGGDELPLTTGAPLQSHKEKFEDIKSGNLRNMWTYHAVADIILGHSLLLSFDEVDAQKTVITGISWGGYLTCLAASLDNRFKAAAPVYGCGFYEDCTFNSDLKRLGAADSAKWKKYFDPSSYLRYAKPSFLFINGNKDGFFFVKAYHKTYSTIDTQRRTIGIKPNMAHGHPQGWAPNEIKCFFDQILYKGVPLVRVGSPVCKDSVITVPFQSDLTVTTATFCYTTEEEVASTKRNWNEIPARINKHTNTVICTAPEFKIGFFTLTDVRNMQVSSEFIFKK